MILATFADESYCAQRKPIVIVIAGWLTLEDKWEQFCQNWQRVLDEFDVKEGFHFVEFAQKKHKNYKKTPYDCWSRLKKENFLFSLALVACDCGFPVGGAYPTEKLTTEAIRIAYRTFFTSVAQTLKTVGKEGDRVKFIFDTNKDDTWRIPRAKVLGEITGKDVPLENGFILESPKKFLHLQAADLYAYAMRQNAERFYTKDNRQPGQPRLLDLILEKNRHDMNNKNDFDAESWSKVMLNAISHYREWSKTNPSKDYRPFLHHPVLKEAMNR